MKKVKKITSILFFLIIAVGVFLIFHFSPEKETEKIHLGGEIFKMEIVDSSEEMELGLGGRKDICDNCGMMFVFLEKGKHSFWMKNMEFPLDILWLENGKIIWIEKNISEYSKKTFSPLIYSDRVLEIKAGTVDRLGIKEGDVIIWD